MNILVINAGSSSMKYQLIHMDAETVVSKGLVERIGQEIGRIKHEYLADGEMKKKVVDMPFANHEKAFEVVAQYLTDASFGVIKNADDIQYVGHRVVHGGEQFTNTQKVTPAMMQELEKLIPLAPIHNPANITGIKAAEKIFKNAAHYAIFDTSFHKTMPAKAFRYAIPNKFYTENGVRVYGFHGTSHKYVDQRTRTYFNNASLKNITIHLGNGASMAAINSKGESIDTSMGLGPNVGMMMGTRAGDIDSAVVFYLNRLGYSVDEVDHILNKESGMLGITGSSDARDVQELYENNTPEGQLCMDMYAYRIQKYIGAYIAALNGVDTIIFTAGIGENSDLTRSLICKNLECFGIKLDEEKNTKFSRPTDIVEVQAHDSRVKIVIVATNEELQIAREIKALI